MRKKSPGDKDDARILPSWASAELEPKTATDDPGMNATGNNSLLPSCINYGFINIPAIPPVGTYIHLHGYVCTY